MSTRNRRKRNQNPIRSFRVLMEVPRAAWSALTDSAQYWWDVPDAQDAALVVIRGSSSNMLGARERHAL